MGNAKEDAELQRTKERIQWPVDCPYCGETIESPEDAEFTEHPPGNYQITLCRECSPRMEGRGEMNDER